MSTPAVANAIGQIIEGAQVHRLGAQAATFRWDNDAAHVVTIQTRNLPQGLTHGTKGRLLHWNFNGHHGRGEWYFDPYPTNAGQPASLPVVPSDVLEISEVGARFTRNPTLEEWGYLTGRLVKAHFRMPFILGDLINYGASRWGDTYTQYIELTGHQYDTLASYAWVCRHVPYEIRRPDLTFEHHKSVAKSALSRPMKEAYLERACQGEFENTREMKDVINRELWESDGAPLVVIEAETCPFCGDRQGWRLAALHKARCTCGAYGEELARLAQDLQVENDELRHELAQARQQLERALAHIGSLEPKTKPVLDN